MLPNACETHITFTMNARELLHFFSLRCCTRAQWGRFAPWPPQMLRLCKEAAPVIFSSAGPGCLRGACPEGAKSCGQAQTVRAFYSINRCNTAYTAVLKGETHGLLSEYEAQEK